MKIDQTNLSLAFLYLPSHHGGSLHYAIFLFWEQFESWKVVQFEWDILANANYFTFVLKFV